MQEGETGKGDGEYDGRAEETGEVDVDEALADGDRQGWSLVFDLKKKVKNGAWLEV